MLNVIDIMIIFAGGYAFRIAWEIMRDFYN